jgi:hypothetical protein
MDHAATASGWGLVLDRWYDQSAASIEFVVDALRMNARFE